MSLGKKNLICRTLNIWLHIVESDVCESGEKELNLQDFEHLAAHCGVRLM